MTQHPYRTLPDYNFWKRSIADAKFRVSPTDRVATAGSCFAQHIARYLSNSGFNYFVTEPGHPMLARPILERFGYGVFTARYGNIYTSRQLIQLLQRAYGLFSPVDDVWLRSDGRCIDPYRPQIQPDGFASIREFHADRQQHFNAIRHAIENLDVFVFTLGLTETWLNLSDGAVYPLCPGVAGF
jgi:hypothetical protein